MRRALIACTALMVAACGTYRPGQHGPNMETLASEADPSEAIVLPPPGGPRVVSVIQNRYPNGVMQKIVLDTDSRAVGENAITVRLYGPVGIDNGDDMLSADHPTINSVQREMVKAFPTVRMSISNYYAQNFYGPFAYAIGTTGGGMCLYGWQVIEPPKNRLLVPRTRGWMTIRVRLCETGATEERLLAYMYGYSVNSYFLAPNWNPYGPPPAVSEDLGGVGQPRLPLPDGGNPYYSAAAADPGLGRVVPVAARASSAPRRTSASRAAGAIGAEAPLPANPVFEPPPALPGMASTSVAPNTPASGAASAPATPGAPPVPAAPSAAMPSGAAMVPPPPGAGGTPPSISAGGVRVVGPSGSVPSASATAPPAVVPPPP